MSTVQVTEDQTYTFKTTDFSSSWTSLFVLSLPTTGTLYLNGTAVSVNQKIFATDVTNGLLTFVPNTDVTTAGAFNFQISGGENKTMSIGVTADAGPSALASSVQVTENLAYTFKVADFGYSDSADKTADPLGSVIITSLPTDGTLRLNGVAVTANQSITASQISGGQLTFVPTANSTAGGSFNFKVTDSLGGTTSATAAAMSISIASSSPAPTAGASSVTVTEDAAYTFKSTDFVYSDSADATTDPMASITITSLPSTGTLQYNGTAITSAQASAGFTITTANIGLLTFVPNIDVTTQGSFQFKVTDTNDNATSPSAATMSLNVTADAGPTAGASSVTVTEDATYTFKSSDFVYSDTADATTDPLGSVVITSLPATGTLKYNGTAITSAQASAGFSISAANIGLLTFVPSTDVTTQGSFQFKVTDTASGGTPGTSAAATMTVNVSPDTGPTAGASSVTVTEDHTYTFKSSDFVYSDSADATTDPMASITITSLPATGALKYNGTAITTAQASAGFTITTANIGLLTYVPNTDVVGNAAATFQFEVTDTASGGTPTTSAAGTMTLNIAADTGPSAGASSVTVTEDATYTFKSTDFVYSDTADATTDPLGSVIITSLPTTGTLKYNGTAITSAQASAGFSISAANVGLLTFVPSTDVTTQGSFSFKVTDSLGGTTSSAATMSLNVSADAGPTAGASSVSVTEDATYTFKSTDFVYSDAADVTTDPLGGVIITSLPTTGTLKYNGTAITSAQASAGFSISAANIGLLTFVPGTDVVTQGSFSFKVTDSLGGTASSAATMSLNVTPDAGPSAVNSSVTVIENKTYTFKGSDFGYSDTADVTTDPLGSVTITSLPVNGSLNYNGTPITSTQASAGFTVTAANIGLLTYVPATNDTTGGSFSFEVTDSLGGTTSATAATLALRITADPGPLAGASTVTVTEDVTYTFKSADFVYSDTFDSTTDPMASVTITSLPATGTLKYNGTAITAAQASAGFTITTANIGLLTFVPNTDVTTQGSFNFEVADTTGGITSAPAAMTVKITADAGPSALASSIAVTQNQTYVFKVADFGYSDTADVTSDPLGSVTVTSLPSDGTLKLSGVAVTTNQSITASQISGGLLTFVPTTNSTASGSFGFKVTDSLGGTTSASAATMSIGISPPGATPSPQLSFAAQNFNTVGNDNSGFYMIPPDPNAAVGLNTVITATNGVIEAFTKSGAALNIFGGSNNESLNSFFVAGLGSLVLTNFNDSNQSGPFDPKIIYDQYTNRFIVVALQESDAGGSFNDTNTSRILIAVSSPDTTPGGTLTWKYTSINSDVFAGTSIDSWADYPGLSVDGAGNIFVTTNLFTHSTGSYQGSRLWTISETDILSGAAGTDATASGKATIYDPSVLSGATSSGSSELFTLMPAQMLPGTGSFATPTGTYLVSYDGASNSQGKVLNVIEVTPNGSGGFNFTAKQINLGNIDSAGAFSSFTAPQLGTRRTIDAGDDRVYSVVFRNGYLYATTMVQSPSTGLATAHWFQINASNPSNLTLTNQGDVSGASIGTSVRTYYPSISVDANGDFAIGFSASGPNNYASAYYEAYKYNSTTNTWTLENPTLLQAGVASYYRTFGGGDNRWGDFSSIVADPSSPSTFWVYNEYAWTQGTTISGENGRWATQVGEFTLPNTTTGPVISGNTTSGSGTTTGSTSPATAGAGFAHLAQGQWQGAWQGSDVNTAANPLLEDDHGPGIGSLPSPHAEGLSHDAPSSSLGLSFAQLVQSMAAFGANHDFISSLSSSNPGEVDNPIAVATNLLHHT